MFTNKEIELINNYFSIDPKKFDYKLPFIGTDQNTNDFVLIKNQSFTDVNRKPIIIPCQYLPKETYEAYIQLNQAMHNEIKKNVLVLYGHRSIARQVFIFFDILERIYNFDVAKTIRRVCFLDYSEHVCMKKQAVDFKTEDSTISDNFDKTEEYRWLQKNAPRFNFHESYPNDNDLDMMYEPWHWHYKI